MSPQTLIKEGLQDGSALCRLLAAEGFSVQPLGVHLEWSTRTFPCYLSLSGGDAAFGLVARLLNAFSCASSPPDPDNQGHVSVVSDAGGSLSQDPKKEQMNPRATVLSSLLKLPCPPRPMLLSSQQQLGC